MTRWVEMSAWVWAALALMVVGIEAVRHRRLARGRMCPGRAVRWAWLKPWAWFLDRGCWYDLSGAVAASDGSVVCPECGTRHAAGLRLNPARRLLQSARAVPVLIVLVLVAASSFKVRWIRAGWWARLLPTDALLVIEEFGPRRWTWHARRELGERQSWPGRLSARQVGWLRRVALDELGGDAVDWNADWAMDVLKYDLDAAVPGLERAMDSVEWQRRQLAAYLLRERWARGASARWGWPPPALSVYAPPDRLFEVTVEGLRDDNLPFDRVRRKETWVDNASDGFEFLRQNPERSRCWCAAGLESDDPQQRVLCAAMFGFWRDTDYIARAAPVLVEHLGNNTIEGDAIASAWALVAFGKAALPYVVEGRESDDAQRARTCALIEAHLDNSPMPAEERWRLNAITHGFSDPLADARVVYGSRGVGRAVQHIVEERARSSSID